MEVARFIALVIKIAAALALIGQLKSCTLVLLGLATDDAGKGMISYSKFTQELTSRGEPKP